MKGKKKSNYKTREQLLAEVKSLRQQVTRLESPEDNGWKEECIKNQALLRSIFRATPVAIGIVTNRVIGWSNPTMQVMLGYSEKELMGKNARMLYPTEEDYQYVGREKYRQIEEHGTGTVETRLLTKDGKVIDVLISSTPLEPGNLGAGVTFTAVDITKRKQAEAKKMELESQLLQAQKLEAIGSLAGGIAHDFNNLLTVINGSSELALMAIDKTHPLYKDLNGIYQAGLRAENLTRQLLAFSRKQVYKPRIINLNQVIAGLEKILIRLIGEDIHLDICAGSNIPGIKADPGHVEQVVMNLLINARDALDHRENDGERKQIIIETDRVLLDEGFTGKYRCAEAGSYVQLSVRDNGVGMEADVKDKIFEPFFTTKELGRGTGLGLSTVYGIVKQHNGIITVDSQPAGGSVFHTYWPAVTEAVIGQDLGLSTAELYTGNETILLVEDDDSVRDFSTRVLRRLGYTVFEAPDAQEALGLVKRIEGSIHLLITDLVLPGMNGKELFEKLKPLLPEIAVLFTSGYLDDLRLILDSEEKEHYFLQKPFSYKTMARKVRKVLDGC